MSVLQEIESLYTDNIRRHGFDAKSVGWRDEATHRLRFDKLVQCLIPDASNEAFTVNDLGSGYGAMFRYLDERYARRLTRYHGYEISDAMIEACATFVGADERIEIHKTSALTHEADYSFVCGTFNVRFKTSDEEWDAYLKETIVQLGRQSRRGFAFNLLTGYVDWQEPHLFYADPCHYFDFCKRLVSRKVTLLHDYPLYEWTIAVMK